MKKIITNLKKMSLGIFASVLFAGSVSATTYTATQSGSWSSALTWGGVGSPGSSIGTVDNVVIPFGVTVTLDMDVDVNSLLSYISVSGGLTSTTNSLTITQGALQGSGTMNLSYVEIGSLGSMTFSGTMTAGTFINSGASLTITGGIIVTDSLILSSGSLTFNTGSTLTMNNNSNVKVDAGSISISGGVLSAINNYDVIYVGGSKTSGIETSISTGVRNINIHMTDSTQIVTMGSNVTVSGALNNTMGKLAIGANTLKLMGDYVATSNGKIQANSTSRLMLESTNAISSPFILSSAAQFHYLEINVGTAVSANFTGNFSVDTMYMKNGSAGFTNSSTLSMASNGVYIWENGSFSLGTGSFIGTNSYNVVYKGVNKTSAFEISGTGLTDVTVNLGSTSNWVVINSNLTVNGMLSMNKGGLNFNAHSVYLNGTFSSTPNGTFQGHNSSSLIINNSASAFGDTINFTSAQSMLDTLSINTMASTWVWLGTALTAENVIMTSGSIMLTNGDLTVNSTGTIAGYDSTKYIGTSGSGSLVMNVNTSSPYVMFPVGTNSSYSPASIQLSSGTSGMFHVKAANGMWSGGTVGTNMALTQSVVNRTWYIQEPTQTGTLSANLKLEWKASEEMNSFDRTHAFISQYTGSAWDASMTGAATSANGTFYSMARPNVSSFSTFAVVDQNATTGIEKVTANSAILGLYPNPASNFVTIDFKNTDAKSVEVYDEIGNRVYSTGILNNNTLQKIDISSLPAGVYYVKVATTANPIFKKLIKS